jgi:CrcB protein
VDVTGGGERAAPARPRPAYQRPSLIALVVLGGALGTALRNAIETTFPAGSDGFPWATLAINLSGAFVLGALLELLTLLGPDQGTRRAIRIGVGTGLLGGYTTYSTFIVETVTLSENGHLPASVLYDTVSLLAGFAAAYLATLLTHPVVDRLDHQTGHRP